MTDSIRPDREAHLVTQMTQALSDAGAFCGECGFEPGDKGCPDCRRHWEHCIEKLLPAVRDVVAAEVKDSNADHEAAYRTLAKGFNERGNQLDVLRPLLDLSENDLIGANLARWEEEQDNKRLRLALKSAQRGRRGLRGRLAELEKAATEGHAALASLCYDHEDPGTAALGALYLLSHVARADSADKRLAEQVLGRREASVLDSAADDLAERADRLAADYADCDISGEGPDSVIATWEAAEGVLRVLATRAAAVVPLTSEQGEDQQTA